MKKKHKTNNKETKMFTVKIAKHITSDKNLKAYKKLRKMQGGKQNQKQRKKLLGSFESLYCSSSELWYKDVCACTCV